MDELNDSIQGFPGRKNEPYGTPEGYFISFEARLQRKLELEELRELAPYLSTLSRNEPFNAPESYFEQLPVVISDRVIAQKNRSSWSWVTKLFRPKFALGLVGVVSVLFFVFLTLFQTEINEAPEYNLANVDEAEIEEYVSDDISASMNEHDLTEFIASTSVTTTEKSDTEDLEAFIVEEVDLDQLIDEL